MAKFNYKAKKGPGSTVEGAIEADSQRQAISKLESMGLFPIEAKQEAASGDSGASRGPAIFFKKKAGYRDLALFTRQLSDLLGSGLTVLKSLEVLSTQTENERLKSIISEMAGFVRDGGNFSDALMRHPDAFNSLYVSVIRAAEVGGMLEPVLNRLADFAEADEDLRSRVRSAFAYPALMAIVGAVTIGVLFVFVIPKLVSMFEDMGQALPLVTQILMGVSDFFINFWWLILAACAMAIFTAKRVAATKEGRLRLHRFKISLPLIGPVIKKSEIARFVRTLGELLTNGVPMLKALEVSSATVGNEVLKQDIGRITKEVEAGEDFSKSLKANPIFADFVINMISIGEKGGKLEEALGKVAGAYERDVDRALKNFTSLLEPAVILIMGVIVGFIVISMLLPIFQINLLAR